MTSQREWALRADLHGTQARLDGPRGAWNHLSRYGQSARHQLADAQRTSPEELAAAAHRVTSRLQSRFAELSATRFPGCGTNATHLLPFGFKGDDGHLAHALRAFLGEVGRQAGIDVAMGGITTLDVLSRGGVLGVSVPLVLDFLPAADGFVDLPFWLFTASISGDFPVGFVSRETYHDASGEPYPARVPPPVVWNEYMAFRKPEPTSSGPDVTPGNDSSKASKGGFWVKLKAKREPGENTKLDVSAGVEVKLGKKKKKNSAKDDTDGLIWMGPYFVREPATLLSALIGGAATDNWRYMLIPDIGAFNVIQPQSSTRLSGWWGG